MTMKRPLRGLLNETQNFSSGSLNSFSSSPSVPYKVHNNKKIPY